MFKKREDRRCCQCGAILSAVEKAGQDNGYFQTCLRCYKNEVFLKLEQKRRTEEEKEAEKFKLLFDTSKEVMLALIAVPDQSTLRPASLAALAVECAKGWRWNANEKSRREKKNEHMP